MEVILNVVLLMIQIDTLYEQIEISKFYERMPKPTAMAIEEFMNGEIYNRYKEAEEAENADQ